MSYDGGLVGVVIAVVTYLKVKRLDVLDWADMLVTGIPLGYTFGQLGNFINGELYGRVTKVSWGMIFPDAEKFNVKLPWVREFAASIGMDVPAALGSSTCRATRPSSTRRSSRASCCGSCSGSSCGRAGPSRASWWPATSRATASSGS